MSTPTFSVVQNPYDFGTLKVGLASALQPFTVTNTSPIFNLTVDNCIILQLTGGGSVVIGCGQGAANGTTVPLPSGYATSRLLMFVTPGTGTGSDQLDGVNVSGHTAGVFNTLWQTRAGAPSGNTATNNYMFLAWTLGAAVTITTSGSVTHVAFTTVGGAQLCISQGIITEGTNFPVPAGFAAADSLNIVGPASAANDPHGFQYIQQCDLAAGTLLATLIYNDNNGNTWIGNLNAMVVFYQPGTVTIDAVTGGSAIVIPDGSGNSLALIFARVNTGSSFGLPPSFTGTISGTVSLAGNVSGSGSNVAHGYQTNALSGLLSTNVIADGLGHTWFGLGAVGAVAVLVPNLAILFDTLASNVGEFIISNAPAFPITLNPGESFNFDVTCTAAYQGLQVYAQALTLTPNALPAVFIQLSYTGFLVTSAFTISGATKGVVFSLSGVWNSAASNYLAQALASLACEADAFWEKQLDFGNASSNTYLNKIFLRTEPAGAAAVTMTDTSMISGDTVNKTCTSNQDSSTDSNGLLKWVQFDFEVNGESHMLQLLLPANSGRLVQDLMVYAVEDRGVVYEGT
jgi:hypothetical protein